MPTLDLSNVCGYELPELFRAFVDLPAGKKAYCALPKEHVGQHGILFVVGD